MKLITAEELQNKNEAELYNLFNALSKQVNRTEGLARSNIIGSLENISRVMPQCF